MSKITCECGNQAEKKEGLKFNGYIVEGWICPKCGIIGYNPKQTEKILRINKLKSKEFRLKLSQIRSNLIVRLPKEISDVMGLDKGDRINFKLEDIDKITIRKII